jgi:hypothetical protein
MLVSLQYVLHTAIIHKTRPLPVAPLYRERNGFFTINARNRMLDFTCHRNLETTYLKALVEGRANSRRLLLKFRFFVLSEFRYPIRPK